MYWRFPLLLLVVAFGMYWYLQHRKITETEYEESLAGKVIIICGASSGIGEETAYQLAEKGAKLILVARTVSKLI